MTVLFSPITDEKLAEVICIFEKKEITGPAVVKVSISSALKENSVNIHKEYLDIIQKFVKEQLY